MSLEWDKYTTKTKLNKKDMKMQIHIHTRINTYNDIYLYWIPWAPSLKCKWSIMNYFSYTMSRRKITLNILIDEQNEDMHLLH